MDEQAGPGASASKATRGEGKVVLLPLVSGLEVLRRVPARARACFLPVVLTSAAEGQDLEESYALGASSYVCKRVSFTPFLKASHQLGTCWLELNRRPPEGRT